MDKAPAPAKVKKGQKHKKPPVATADQDDESEVRQPLILIL